MSSDEFMFNIFDLCADIYHSNKRNEYVMLSSGANYLSLTNLWKVLCDLEVNYDFMYNWYTSPQGFPCLTSFLKLYTDFLATKGELGRITPFQIASTGGGSQAAAIAFSYIKDRLLKEDVKVLAIGPSYSLYERLCNKNRFKLELCLGENNFLPNYEKVKNSILSNEYEIILLTIPNNPTGEVFAHEEVVSIVSLVKKLNKIMIVDIVPQMYITEKDIIDIESIIYEIDAVNNVILINSFSKTDGVPGFRIGYLCGSKDLIEFASNYQLNELMNVPVFPVFPVVFTVLFRMLYISQKKAEFISCDVNKLIKIGKQIIDTTCAIPNKKFISLIYERFETSTFMNDYQEYVFQQLQKEKTISNNLKNLKKTLESEIKCISELKNGFNVVIKFNEYSEDELSFIINLLRDTGVSVLTESCFDLTNSAEFYIRISLAIDEDRFSYAINQVSEYLKYRKETK